MRGGVKKPSLKKKVTVKVGKKAVIKLKNGKKEAKVSWKTGKKSVVKILKKKTKTKGNKACAVIKGVSEGKAKITAVYKLGKKVTRLKCTVTVKTKGQTQDIPQDPSIIMPKNTDVPTAGPGGTATDVPDVTDKPATEAPKTDAPPTVKPTDAPDRPTVTNDPYASELAVPMTKANQAFAAEEATYNEDGTVSVALSPADSGHGICFYLNAEKLSVDLTDYKELVIAYDSKDAYEMAISLKEYIPDTAADSYWDGADSSKCPIVDSEKYTTFSKGAGEYRLDISSIKETAGGVFIKYNTYNAGDAASLPDAEMTIKSIKLIKDPATVATQPPATEEPGPGTSEEPGTSAEPDTSKEPGTTDEPSVTEDPYADLKVNISKANEAFLDTNGKAEYNEDGTVKVSLNKDNSGMGICFYLNDAHTSVDLSQYKSLEIAYETGKAYDMAISMKGEIPAGAASDYWAGADSSKCPIVGTEQYTTFASGSGKKYTLSLSSIKEAAQGVFIKYNTYQKEETADQLAEITIKSITLIKDPAFIPTATPEPTATPDPNATATPEPSPTPENKKVSIKLDESSLAYGEATFADGKMTATTTNSSGGIGLYVNTDKSGILLNQYKVMKVKGTTSSGKAIKLQISFMKADISEYNASERLIYRTYTMENNETEGRLEYMTAVNGANAHDKYADTEFFILNIQDSRTGTDGSEEETWTIESITLEEQDTTEILDIEMTEDNVIESTAESLSIENGVLKATFKNRKDYILLKLKPDGSSVTFMDYKTVDMLGSMSASNAVWSQFCVHSDDSDKTAGTTHTLTFYSQLYFRSTSMSLYNFNNETEANCIKLFANAKNCTLELRGLRLSM